MENEDGKEADLNWIIEKIDDIKYPDWMDTAKKAHQIRKKRNLVHAKLCLKENVKIDKMLCKQVVKYLKTIIETRYRKKKQVGKEEHVRHGRE